jgi:hypothetical protein
MGFAGCEMTTKGRAVLFARPLAYEDLEVDYLSFSFSFSFSFSAGTFPVSRSLSRFF